MKKRIDKKKIIGNIQLIIGVILLIGGIVGIIILANRFQPEINNNQLFIKNSIEEIQENSNLLNDTKDILIGNMATTFYLQGYNILLIFISLISTFGLTIIISILFITQGLVNLSERRN